MRNSRLRRFERGLRLTLAAAMTATMFGGSCLSSEIAKRFREVYAPGLATGLATAVTEPGQAETGLRLTWAALNEAFAAMLQNRTSPASSDQ